MGREISKNIAIKEKRPSFFKIILGGYSTDHMRIPPKFLRHVSREMAERATLKLKAPSDCSWHVRVIETESGVYFKDGWQEFLDDNSIGNTDFLVFLYDGKMHFTIQIFDRSGCERFVFSNSDRTYQNHTSAGEKMPRDRPRKSKPCKDNSAGSSESVEIEEDTEEDFLNSKAKDWEAFKSPFPHFKGIIYKRVRMAFPASFARKHLSPDKSQEIELRNSKGRTWLVKAVPSSGTHFFSKGWARFAKDNKIKVGHTCMFELVSRNKMVVHIFGK